MIQLCNSVLHFSYFLWHVRGLDKHLETIPLLKDPAASAIWWGGIPSNKQRVQTIQHGWFEYVWVIFTRKNNIAVPKKSDSFCTFCLALPLFICELCSALITKSLERDQHKPASEAEAGTPPTFACLPFLFDYSPGIIFVYSDNCCLHVFDWRWPDFNTLHWTVVFCPSSYPKGDTEIKLTSNFAGGSS